MIHVLDVSNFQHPNGAPIDWNAVRASGVEAVILKATEGTGYTNPYFASDLVAARAAGLKVGAYHFARPSQTRPGAEAAYFVSVAGSGLDFYVLDSEDPGAAGWDLRAWCTSWLNAVSAALGGLLPWIYSYQSYLTNTLKGDSHFAGYPLWEAAYQSSAPAAPAPWSGWRLWQYTSSASVPGISGAVDESVLDGALPQGGDMTPEKEAQLFQQLGEIHAAVVENNYGALGNLRPEVDMIRDQINKLAAAAPAGGGGLTDADRQSLNDTHAALDRIESAFKAA